MRTLLPGDPTAGKWSLEPERRLQNGGLGCCRTGSGRRVVCCLGGIGCDIDHVSIARINLEAGRITAAVESPSFEPTDGLGP